MTLSVRGRAAADFSRKDCNIGRCRCSYLSGINEPFNWHYGRAAGTVEIENKERRLKMSEHWNGHLVAVVCHCLCGEETLRIVSEAIVKIAEAHHVGIPQSCLSWLTALLMFLVLVGGACVVKKVFGMTARFVTTTRVKNLVRLDDSIALT